MINVVFFTNSLIDVSVPNVELVECLRDEEHGNCGRRDKVTCEVTAKGDGKVDQVEGSVTVVIYDGLSSAPACLAACYIKYRR